MQGERGGAPGRHDVTTPSRRALTLSVIVPVFNERYLVRESLRRVLAVKVDGIAAIEVVVVDDCSTDGTRELLRAIASEHPDRITLLEQPRNGGKGSALRRGIAEATGDLIVFQDADLEYDPRDYARMVRPFLEDDADVVFGSRFAAADRRRVLNFRHELVNKLLTVITSWVTDLTLSDMETCYKMFRAHILKSIPIRSDRFGIEPEITIKVAKRNCRIFEVPISYSGRTHREGKKITWKDGVSALSTIARFTVVDDLYDEEHYDSYNLVRLERTRRFSRWMADALMPHLGARVLEINAGLGDITSWLLPRDRFVASDTRRVYLEYLANLALNRPYMEVMRLDTQDASTFTAIEGQFDTIVCINVLEQVADPVLALQNMRRALQDGGRLLIYVPQGPALYSPLDKTIGRRCRYTREGLTRELEAAGFRVESITGFNRTATAAWVLNGKLLGRARLSRVQLKLFDVSVPLLRHVDRWSPLPPLGLIAVAKR